MSEVHQRRTLLGGTDRETLFFGRMAVPLRMNMPGVKREENRLSSLPGGTADKLGNRYEDWWVLLRLADVLQGKAERLRREPPGAGGAGIEFWVEDAGGRCCEQVKDRPAKGNWTLNRLVAEGVLGSVVGHLAAGHDVRFVSSTPAAELGALSARARTAETFAEYSES